MPGMLNMRCATCKKPLKSGDQFLSKPNGDPIGMCKTCYKAAQPFFQKRRRSDGKVGKKS